MYTELLVKLAEFLIRSEQVRWIGLVLASDFQNVCVIFFQIVSLLETVDGDRLQAPILSHAVGEKITNNNSHHLSDSKKHSRINPRHKAQQLSVVAVGGELHLCNVVQEEVKLRKPRLERDVDHLREGCCSLRIRLTGQQRVANVVDRLYRDPRNAGSCHESKHVQYQIAMLAHYIKCSTAKVHELVEFRRRPITSVYHISHI